MDVAGRRSESLFIQQYNCLNSHVLPILKTRNQNLQANIQDLHATILV